MGSFCLVGNRGAHFTWMRSADTIQFSLSPCPRCRCPLQIYKLSLTEHIALCTKCTFPLDSAHMHRYIREQPQDLLRIEIESHNEREPLWEGAPEVGDDPNLFSLERDDHPPVRVIGAETSSSPISITTEDTEMSDERGSPLLNIPPSQNPSPPLPSGDWDDSVLEECTIPAEKEANKKQKGRARAPPARVPRKDEEAIRQLQSRIERTTSRITLGRFVGDPYTPCNILAHDLQTLLPRRWIEEGALHLYFILLTRRYHQFGYIPSSSLPPFRHDQAPSEGMLPSPAVSTIFEQLIGGDIDSILLPMRLMDVWMLCVISGDGNIYIYDSTASSPRTHTKVLKRLVSWVTQQVDEIEWELCNMSQKPHLIDQCNHAVMVAVFGELYCQCDEDPQKVAEQALHIDPSRYRSFMLSRLYHGFRLRLPEMGPSSVEVVADLVKRSGIRPRDEMDVGLMENAFTDFDLDKELGDLDLIGLE